MKRRAFLGAAAATIFAPTFGRWYRRGSGLVVPDSYVTAAEVNAYFERSTLLRIVDVQGEVLTIASPLRPMELNEIVAHGVNAKGEPSQIVMHVASTIGFRPGQTIVLRGWPHQSQGRA